jgi:hypothetical protein
MSDLAAGDDRRLARLVDSSSTPLQLGLCAQTSMHLQVSPHMAFYLPTFNHKMVVM